MSNDSDSYDQNFCYPLPKALENDRVKLVPFVPSIHAKEFFDLSSKYSEVYEYLPWGPFKDQDDFESVFEERFRQNPTWMLFAVFDKTKPSEAFGEDGALAGAMGYINSMPVNLATEIGAVIVFPPFQRTHVASNAVGLMLQYALNTPGEGGLGLRRIVWQANYLNKASINLAQRLKFQLEGILRWDRVLPANLGKELAGNGRGVRAKDPKPDCVGRDTAMLSLCWDDWESGAEEHLAAEMARTK
ncbi:hypothetical protein D9611_008911 [Ephemerocybe angulata]|uniref:N-acetyltransferase domain-containing protein n=1 Tax=Ephemerocybe angulata TaxID=980116 RepID=A0A8H5FCY9_9AGAR|nr:hypothetical protein D9611_008911 [Tulosesus angulatus]